MRRACRFFIWMSLMILAVTAAIAQAPQPAVYSNPQLAPAHWRIQLHEDGSGQFDAEGGPAIRETNGILAGDVHRAIQLSPKFTAMVFATAREERLFAIPCESHLKVAFQGTKRLSYSGPEGSGNCEFNYSRDKQIQALGDALQSVETTLLHGARLEKLLQHDRLGVDKETEDLAAEAKSGSALELGVIRDVLTRIAGDDQILERARRRARLLLGQIS